MIEDTINWQDFRHGIKPSYLLHLLNDNPLSYLENYYPVTFIYLANIFFYQR